MELWFIIPFLAAGSVAFALARWLSLRLQPSEALSSQTQRDRLTVLVGSVLLLFVAVAIANLVVGSISVFALRSGLVLGSDNFESASARHHLGRSDGIDPWSRAWHRALRLRGVPQYRRQLGADTARRRRGRLAADRAVEPGVDPAIGVWKKSRSVPSRTKPQFSATPAERVLPTAMMASTRCRPRASNP